MFLNVAVKVPVSVACDEVKVKVVLDGTETICCVPLKLVVPAIVTKSNPKKPCADEQVTVAVVPDTVIAVTVTADGADVGIGRMCSVLSPVINHFDARLEYW